MTLPRTVSDVLAEHTSFEIECIDRIYLNVYVPLLQFAAGIVSYVHRQLGRRIHRCGAGTFQPRPAGRVSAATET